MIELYKHNAYAYNQIEEKLKVSNRTCIIHPTGSGKSFIAIKWLYENRDKKCLFLTSQKPIIDQIIRHIENCGMTLADFPNLSFELYSNVSEDYANNHKADCIVLDEFHRCGAPEWGKNLNSLLDNNKNAKVLGVSATPIRYLDDNRNMAEELFNNNIASEISLVEAVSKGILPLPTYINAIYSFEQNIQEIQNKINKLAYEKDRILLEEQLNKAKRILEKSEGLREVFSKYITKQNGKFIVFCKDLGHMNRMIAESREWFKDVNPDIDIYSVYSANNDSLNKLAVDSFEQNNGSHLKLLFCVNMLNEGLHVNDIDGVIMLRPTVSPIIYLQQLGRALSVGHNAEPLIFDIVNNSNCISDIKEFYQKVKRNIENGNKNPALDGYKDIELDDFTIVDEMSSMIDLLSSLYKCITKETIEQSKAKKLYDDLLKLGHQPNRNTSKYESSLYTALINHGREWLTDEQLVTLGQYGIYIPQQLSQEDLGLILYDDLMTLGHQPSQNIAEEQNLYGRLAARGEKFLSQEQLAELAKYGIYIPKAITSEERGNQLYEELIKFGKQPRRTSEDQTEVNLYGRFQRHGREWLTDEQIKSLSEIGITLPVQKDEKKESEQFFNELIQLGHQPKKSNPEEISLYKKLMRRGPSLLTPEQFEKLAKYGIGLPKKLSEEDYVNQTFVDLINLGRLPFPKNTDERPLYVRVRKWKDKFTLEQKNKLEKLGIYLKDNEYLTIVDDEIELPFNLDELDKINEELEKTNDTESKIVLKKKIEEQKEEIIKKSKEIDETIKNNKSTSEINNVEREELKQEEQELSSSDYKTFIELFENWLKNNTKEKVKRNSAVSLYTKLRSRDEDGNFRCELCNCAGFSLTDFESHHFIPLSKNGPDNIYNTVCLCPNCHTNIHNNKITYNQKYNLLMKIKQNIEKYNPEYIEQFNYYFDEILNIYKKTLDSITNIEEEKEYYKKHKEQIEELFKIYYIGSQDDIKHNK